MPRYKDETPAVRVYTVCDESKYLIVRNVPALGCSDELLKLFASYGDIEDFKPMDAEDCEQYTDVYWIKFRLFSNARFAKRKLDEYVFMGNRLKVSYAPEFESVSDTREKLECRRKEVLSRLNPGRSKGSSIRDMGASGETSSLPAMEFAGSHHYPSGTIEPPISHVSSNQEYFPSQSMNETVNLVREKLNKIQSIAEHSQTGPASKKARVDNRRRI